MKSRPISKGDVYLYLTPTKRRVERSRHIGDRLFADCDATGLIIGIHALRVQWALIDGIEVVFNDK